MLFSSIPFLYYFLPVTLLCYFAVPKRFKNLVLLISSMFFYAWGEKLLVFLFMISILIGWGSALLIEKSSKSVYKKTFVLFAVLYDLGLLIYFKYSDFFIENLNILFRSHIPLLKVALPIGISFFTFQLLSYDIDVYRGTVSAQKNLIDFAAYVSMFPQLIAGPIVRYADVCGYLTERAHSFDMAASGIRRFVSGLCKKILIANILGEIAVKFSASTQLSVLYYWLYAVSYGLQIYFDFSGYSDMAIGLGRIFGFSFMENFNYPYISASITEFWRRWHISLGSWFRDYVYIPLGGNRKGIKRQLMNILTVWMLTGLWHGASWNFVLWGILFAILLTCEKLGLKNWLDRHKIIGHLYTIFFVFTGFIIFNATTIHDALSTFSGLFSFFRIPLVTPESLYVLRSYGLIIIIGIVFSTPLPVLLLNRIRGHHKISVILDYMEPVIIIIVLIIVTAYLVDGSFNPFLYFRF